MARRTRAAAVLTLLVLGCHPQPSGSPRDGDDVAGQPHRLPTGAMLQPAGRTTPVGQFPWRWCLRRRETV